MGSVDPLVGNNPTPRGGGRLNGRGVRKVIRNIGAIIRDIEAASDFAGNTPRFPVPKIPRPGIIGGVFVDLLIDLLFPPPTARDDLSQIDPSLLQGYKPEGEVTVEFGSSPPFTGGQEFANYYVSCDFKNSNTFGNTCNAIVHATSTSKANPYVPGKIESVDFSFNSALNATVLQATSTLANGTTKLTPLGKFGTGSNVILSPGCAVKTNNSLGWANTAEVLNLSIVKADGSPDTGGDPPGGTPATKEPTPPSPTLPPPQLPPPQLTPEDFFKIYGKPPKLRGILLRPPQIDSGTNKTPAPVKGREAAGVSTGKAPTPKLTKEPIPTLKGGKTTTYIDSKTQILTKDGLIIKKPAETEEVFKKVPPPPPQLTPDTNFQEETTKKLEELITQTSQETQITTTKKGICESIQKPEGCMNPIIKKLDDLLDDDDDPQEPKTEDIEVTLGKCEGEDEHIWTETSLVLTVPKGLGLFVKTSFEETNKIGKALCAMDCAPPTPQDWMVKRSVVPPQLVLVYRRLGIESKGYNKICVPWLQNIEPTTAPLLPDYTKGQHYGALYFSDNSKFVIYCSSREEAEELIVSVQSIVRADKLDSPPRTSFGIRQGMPIKSEGMHLAKQYYYPNGQQQGGATWMRYVIHPE